MKATDVAGHFDRKAADWDAGFSQVTMETVHRIRKTRENGIREYPVFCAVGRADRAASQAKSARWAARRA